METQPMVSRAAIAVFDHCTIRPPREASRWVTGFVLAKAAASSGGFPSLWCSASSQRGDGAGVTAVSRPHRVSLGKRRLR